MAVLMSVLGQTERTFAGLNSQAAPRRQDSASAERTPIHATADFAASQWCIAAGGRDPLPENRRSHLRELAGLCRIPPRGRRERFPAKGPRERRQRREFGAARATHTPRRLKHPRSRPTVGADSLTDIVVPARGRETVELHRCFVVASCCSHCRTCRGGHRNCAEPLPAPAHASGIRPAVNRPPLVVPHGPLRSVIADPKAADPN